MDIFQFLEPSRNPQELHNCLCPQLSGLLIQNISDDPETGLQDQGERDRGREEGIEGREGGRRRRMGYLCLYIEV